MNSSWRKWLRVAQYAKVFRFLGSRATAMLVFGTVVGCSLFFIEIAFAYGLQGLLLALGVMDEKLAAELPRWLPRSGLNGVLIFLCGVGVFRGLMYWAQTFMQGAVVEEIKYLQRARMLRWVFHSESVSSAEVNILFNDRINAAASSISSLQVLATQFTVTVLLGLSLFKLSLPLTLLNCAILTVMGLALRLTQRRIKTLGQEMNQEWERVNRQLAVSIKNLLLMQIYGTQVREEKKAQNSLSSYRDNVVSYFRILGFQTFLPQVCGFFIICLICYASRSYQLLTATATVTYLYVFIRFLQGVAVILQSSSNWILYWPHVLKLAEWWANHSHDGIRRSRPIEMMMPSASPALEPIGWKFSNVRFSYPGATSEIIRDFDLEVEPGSAVVITGPSGSGKTTLLHLMLGTLIPMRGQVDVLFQEGRKISLLQYRSSLLNGIGYVGPESFLIEGTIYQNLTYGLLKTPSEIEVKEALTLAECHFVFDTPAGLQSQLTEQGHGLSAGQKQRLSLARALLRHPKALILDEATANLDLEVESKLVDTLSRLKNKITVVAVTHREGLLRIADKKIRLSGT